MHDRFFFDAERDGDGNGGGGYDVSKPPLRGIDGRAQSTEVLCEREGGRGGGATVGSSFTIGDIRSRRGARW